MNVEPLTWRSLWDLHPVAPFNFDALLHKPDHFLSDVSHQLDEMEHISPWEQKIYSRLFLGRDPETPAPVATLQALFNARFTGYRMLAVHYIWEDLFWQRKDAPVDWLEPLIRL